MSLAHGSYLPRLGNSKDFLFFLSPPSGSFDTAAERWQPGVVEMRASLPSPSLFFRLLYLTSSPSSRPTVSPFTFQTDARPVFCRYLGNSPLDILQILCYLECEKLTTPSMLWLCATGASFPRFFLDVPRSPLTWLCIPSPSFTPL